MCRHVNPTIALCVVAHADEQHLIPETVASARACVDELLVQRVTVEGIGAARNAALSATTSDWVLMLDAGERLEAASGPGLREMARRLPADSHGYAMRLRRGNDLAIDELVPRFFSKRSNLVWRGDVHAELVPLNPADAVHLTEADASCVIRHARSRPDESSRIEQALQCDPRDARLRYYLGASYLHAGRTAEAAACFKICLQTADLLPDPIRVDAFGYWLEALIALGDTHGIARVARRGEVAQALSPAAREMLAEYNERRGRLTDARRELVLALDRSVSPFGLVRPDGVGGWRTRLHLAMIDQQLALLDEALAELSTAHADVPLQHRFSVAVLATQIAAGHDAALARQWLERAVACAPDDLDAEMALVQLRLAVPDFTVDVDDTLVVLDRALAREDWQTAYDVAVRLPLGKLGALARVLHLARCLCERGAADAALDLLDRALDVYPRSRPVLWLVMSVLIDLERYEDAQTAVEVLQLLRRTEQPELSLAA
jgi:tetratricopeptide (TPR) repeat protein